MQFRYKGYNYLQERLKIQMLHFFIIINIILRTESFSFVLFSELRSVV